MRILEEALTFDDVLLVPAYSEILPGEVDLSTRVTRRIRLNVPLLSAAMDTVTEARLAITIAQEGGIGIIHKSMSIEAQAAEVDRVKKFESGVIKDPITVTPDTTIREVLEHHGYRVVEAADGDRALDQMDVHEGRVDLVLADFVMLRMSGPTLADGAIRARGDTTAVG